MRIPLILLASAAALALPACNSNSDPASSNQTQLNADDVDAKSLEKQLMAALDDAPKHGLTRDLFVKADLPAEGSARTQALLQAASDYASAHDRPRADQEAARRRRPAR